MTPRRLVPRRRRCKDMWIGLVFPGTRAGGAANTARMLGFEVKPNTNIVNVEADTGA